MTPTQEARDLVWLVLNASPRSNMDDLARGVQAIIDAAEERGARMALEVAAYERSIVLKQELIEALSAEVERWKGFAARAARQMDDMAGDTGNESPDLSDEIQAALGAKP
jgi:phage I-like protein